MATDKHGLKKIFCCFNKNRICDGKGISVHQCKSVANSGVLGWVLKTKKINSACPVGRNDRTGVLSVAKYSGVELCELCVLRVLIRAAGCGINKIKNSVYSVAKYSGVELCELCG